MELSNELVSQIVKATQDTDTKSSESVVYGTAIVNDGVISVQIDGSTVTTPATTTTDVSDGDRVTVMIKDHSAVITGNISSPSANSSAVQNVDKKVGEFTTVIADKANLSDLYAERARIDELTATNLKVEGTLTATKAEIESLNAKNVTIEETLIANKAIIESLDASTVKTDYLESNYAKINDLDVVNQKVYNLDATHLSFVNATGENLDVINANIQKLEADNANIKGTLTANNADIVNLQADNAHVRGMLTANNADIVNLQAENAHVRGLLTANNADIVSLYADNATIRDTLNANNANIVKLQADLADIDVLKANVAKVDTLIFGSASGDTIQSQFANAVVQQIGDAQIKSAMIDSVAANKITAGRINTNEVTVGSKDGRLVISDETIQISDETRVRVQIGKDASEDYSINIWDSEGKLMFSKGGITDSAIKTAIIRNDMVREDASISASKLDISSLFEEINGSTQTIESNRILLNDKNQTLTVAFAEMSTSLDKTKETVTSHGTSISTIQGQISQKVWEQDIIKGDVTELNTNYSTLNQTVGEISAQVASHTTELSKKADGTAVAAVNDRVTEAIANLDGFKTTVSNTYVTTTELDEELDEIEIGGRNLLRNSQTLVFVGYLFQPLKLIEVEHDNDGNVAIVSPAFQPTHDGEGNVTIGSNIIFTDDGHGTVTLKGGT